MIIWNERYMWQFIGKTIIIWIAEQSSLRLTVENFTSISTHTTERKTDKLHGERRRRRSCVYAKQEEEIRNRLRNRIVAITTDVGQRALHHLSDRLIIRRISWLLCVGNFSRLTHFRLGNRNFPIFYCRFIWFPICPISNKSSRYLQTFILHIHMHVLLINLYRMLRLRNIFSALDIVLCV